MKNLDNPLAGTIIGALVADAASMGFHWLYDQKRIREVSPEYPEFKSPAAADYSGVPGYFAHGCKDAGDFSQYGEQAMVLLRSLVANGGCYDKDHYEKLFCDYFGYGGRYIGYIDHPTRDTLNNVARAESDKQQGKQGREGYHGADDVQLPALAKLPALIAIYSNTNKLQEVVESAVRVTNNNDLAVDFGLTATAIIEAVIQGSSPERAVAESVEKAPQHLAELIKKTISLTPEDNLTVTATFGTSCNLAYGVPATIHNVLTADSYRTAVRRNIYAGGDSCGRAVLLGAILGAAHGIGGEKGVPLEWIEKLNVKDKVVGLVTQLLNYRGKS